MTWTCSFGVTNCPECVRPTAPPRPRGYAARRQGTQGTQGTYLNSRFEEKDQIKALGGRWDPDAKRWYVPPGLGLTPFAKWLPIEAAPVATPRRALRAEALEPLVPPSRSATPREPEIPSWVTEVVGEDLRAGYVRTPPRRPGPPEAGVVAKAGAEPVPLPPLEALAVTQSLEPVRTGQTATFDELMDALRATEYQPRGYAAPPNAQPERNLTNANPQLRSSHRSA
jgi:hypothetical protein